MLRRTIIGSIVVAAAMITPTLAFAGSTHSVTVVSRLSYPSGWEFSTTYCPHSGTHDATGTHESGPATPPLGSGSLVVAVPPGGIADLIDEFPSEDDQDLSATTLSSYRFPVNASDTPMTATAHLYLNQGPDDDYYDLSAPLPMASGWQRSNLLAASTWDSGTGAFGSPPETPVGAGTGTYSQFLTGSSAATLGQLDIHFNNCSGGTTQKYALDDLTTGITLGTSPNTTTTNTTVNFEASPPTVLTTHLSATAITAGGRVKPSVLVTVQSVKDTAGFDLTLSEKTAGTSTYQAVVTRTTNSAGVATAPAQKLTRTTSFRWTYVPLKYSIYQAGTSKTVTVSVAPKVTLHLAKTLIGTHGELHASGVVKPSGGPGTVTLRATKSGHTVTATGRERADGSYVITKRLAAGRYQVEVRVGKDATNGAGTSRRVTVIVN
jgi:hypothetical protein